VENLPEGLKLDAAKGFITGSGPEEKGDYAVTLRAKNQHGSTEKAFTIIVGDKLALTPPMGWNSWYIHYNRVTEQHMRTAAEQMVVTGMADVGYMYVNIDDCWMKKRDDEPYRDEGGAMLPNDRFPDIRGMVDHIHSRGLRAGLYTSPGPWTCAGYVGSYRHEQIDAETYAGWRFDFLKYDWCSYGRAVAGDFNGDVAYASKPYRHMGGILPTLERDIVLNLCQYGKCEVWKWGEEVGGHCWRTTGDLGLRRGDRLPGFYHIGFSNMRHWQHARPGAWNDPDYILIGWVGAAHGMKEGKPTTLSGNEQYSYMSMWCLMAAPLIFSGDMAKLDEFTLNVLCNPEVIAVDQDALGKQGRPIRHTDDELILAKPMEDRSLAVGLFNLSEVEREVKVTWDDLGLKGQQRVRDLWRHKDIGQFEDQFHAKVPRHGVVLVRLFRQS
jgi:alpha-galactosidase